MLQRLVFDDEGQYAGAWDCAQQVIEKEGVSGLYVGAILQVTLTILSTALFYMQSLDDPEDEEEEKSVKK